LIIVSIIIIKLFIIIVILLFLFSLWLCFKTENCFDAQFDELENHTRNISTKI